MQYIETVKAVYGDFDSDRPQGYIEEINGRSADINKGCGGSFVWLLPVYTEERAKAATSFEFILSPDTLEGPIEIGKYSSGDFRYLKPRYDAKAPKILELAFHRVPGDRLPPKTLTFEGFDAATPNLNRGRKGEVLRLLWKSEPKSLLSSLPSVSLSSEPAPTQFIQDLAVAYGDFPSDRPAEFVKEINGRRADINKGCGGWWVWLVPVYTEDRNKAATSFEFILSDDELEGPIEIGKGSAVPYRYLKPKCDVNSPKIVDVTLLRGPTKESVYAPVEDFDGKTGTGSLNEGRGEDFLRLLWKLEPQSLLSMPTVSIPKIPSAPTRWVRDVKAFNGLFPSERPSEFVKEINGRRSDLNKDCGGEWVWLVPVYTNDRSQAATAFELIVSDETLEGPIDIGHNSKGGFRYIKTRHDADAPKVLELALYRGPNEAAVNAPVEGFDVGVKNLNEGREAEHLRLLVKREEKSMFSLPSVSLPSVKTSTRWVQTIKAVYGNYPSERPPEFIKEFHGRRADINKDCGGWWVWLVPVYTEDRSKGATSFDFILSEDELEDRIDIAKGAARGFRYLKPRYDPAAPRIVELTLLREMDAEAEGFEPEHGTGDLNQGRDGGCLRLLWKFEGKGLFSLPSVGLSTASANPRFLKALKVVYGDYPSDRPSEIVKEFNGRRPDINKGCGGWWVWLVPVYTFNRDEAVTSFEYIFSNDPLEGRLEIGKGAAGGYRYLEPVYSKGARKIADVTLLRGSSMDAITAGAAEGFDAGTGNLNEGRGDDCLRLLWKYEDKPGLLGAVRSSFWGALGM